MLIRLISLVICTQLVLGKDYIYNKHAKRKEYPYNTTQSVSDFEWGNNGSGQGRADPTARKAKPFNPIIDTIKYRGNWAPKSNRPRYRPKPRGYFHSEKKQSGILGRDGVIKCDLRNTPWGYSTAVKWKHKNSEDWLEYGKKSHNYTYVCGIQEALDVSCELGRVIRVTGAFYGRYKLEGDRYCPTHAQVQYGCALDLKYRFKYRCDGKTRCHWIIDYLDLGDPCPTYNKYFKLNYYCEPDAKYLATSFNTLTIRDLQEDDGGVYECKSKFADEHDTPFSIDFQVVNPSPDSNGCPPSGPNAGDTEQWVYYTDTNKPKCYGTDKSMVVTYGEASRWCRSRGAWLAVPDNARHTGDIVDAWGKVGTQGFDYAEWIWVGVNELRGDGWRMATGTRANKNLPWDDDQPDNNLEHCSVLKITNKKLHDAMCHKVNPFLCATSATIWKSRYDYRQQLCPVGWVVFQCDLPWCYWMSKEKKDERGAVESCKNKRGQLARAEDGQKAVNVMIMGFTEYNDFDKKESWISKNDKPTFVNFKGEILPSETGNGSPNFETPRYYICERPAFDIRVPCGRAASLFNRKRREATRNPRNTGEDFTTKQDRTTSHRPGLHIGALVKGDAVNHLAAPWMAKIYYRSQSLPICVGTFIAFNFVITALKCAMKPTKEGGLSFYPRNNNEPFSSILLQPGDLSVGYGFNDNRRSKNKIYHVSAIRSWVNPHGSYQDFSHATRIRFSEDIVVLELNLNIYLTEGCFYVIPICLPDSQPAIQNIPDGWQCYLSGYAKHSGAELESCKIDAMHDEFEWDESFTNTLVFPWPEGRDHCRPDITGDFGSPWMCQDKATSIWRIIAVTSYHHLNDSIGAPVQRQLPYIEEIILVFYVRIDADLKEYIKKGTTRRYRCWMSAKLPSDKSITTYLSWWRMGTGKRQLATEVSSKSKVDPQKREYLVLHLDSFQMSDEAEYMCKGEYRGISGKIRHWNMSFTAMMDTINPSSTISAADALVSCHLTVTLLLMMALSICGI